MEKASPKILLLSLFLLSVSTCGGALLAFKLGGSSAGYQSLFMGAPAALAIFIAQVAIYLSIRERLLFAIVFLAAFCLTFFWFMFCLFAPILWIEKLPAYVKVIAGFILIALYLCNYFKGSRDFARGWAEVRDPLAIGKINRAKNTIEWEKVQRSLQQKNRFIYSWPAPVDEHDRRGIVGRPDDCRVEFTSAFPIFSAFAWGIPCALISSIFLQLMGFKVAEAKKIREIQADLAIKFNLA